MASHWNAVLLQISLVVAVTLLGIAKGQGDLDYRLPKNVRPSKYVLSMRMVLDENDDGFPLFTAPGNATITLTCTEPTDTITLNEQYITIVEDGVTLDDISNASAPAPVPIAGHSYEPALHFYRIRLNYTLVVGRNYSLHIPFISKILTNDTLGLYRGYYTDELANNTLKNISTTFFQPFGGRRAFPCFDEPDLKAIFEISIGRLRKYHALVNTDIRRTVTDPKYPDWEWDEFNPTVPMSTYLVCMIVSDFAAETADPSIFPGKPVKVWGTPAAIAAQGGVYAAEVGARLLVWYENFTGIPYALNKMDSIAIPQFAAGAMENWGLNTYRDAYLIFKPGDPESAKIGVAETLAHELSHQWFGNLVTCEWWDMMWLNEGVATYFTYKSLTFLIPEFDTEMRYITIHHQNALKFDADVNRTHPVVIPTVGFNFFDGTSMRKGGALTRMMDYLFTFPVFQAGFRIFLERYAYQGAVQDDLFQAFQEALEQSGKLNVLPQRVTVKQVFDPWTLQTGFPLVRVSKSNNTLSFSQENIIAVQPNHTWWVPIKIVSENNPVFTDQTPDLWMAPNELSASYNLSGNASAGWIVINPDAAGFYRVLYDDTLFTLIERELNANPEAFTPITRAMIIDDRLNLGLSEYLPLDKAVEATAYLRREKNPGVLSSAVGSIEYILRQSKKFNGYTEIKRTLVGRLEEILDSMDSEDESEDTVGLRNILRNNLIRVLCTYESQHCVRIAGDYYKRIKAASGTAPLSIVPADLRDAIYCGIVQTGGEEAWKLISDLRSRTRRDDRQIRSLSRALGCTRMKDSAMRSLHLAASWDDENRLVMLEELVMSSMGREALRHTFSLSSSSLDKSYKLQIEKVLGKQL